MRIKSLLHKLMMMPETHEMLCTRLNYPLKSKEDYYKQLSLHDVNCTEEMTLYVIQTSDKIVPTYISRTIMNQLPLLKFSGKENWELFSDIWGDKVDEKETYIFSNTAFCGEVVDEGWLRVYYHPKKLISFLYWRHTKGQDRFDMFSVSLDSSKKESVVQDDQLPLLSSLFRLLCFCHKLDGTSTEILGIGSKSWAKEYGMHLINGNEFKVKLLKITDLNKVVRVGEFAVGSHWALRAHGVGRSHRKLVFIESYTKKGYNND